MGHVDHGHLQALLQVAYLVLHLFTQAPVQRAQRLVHQYQVWFEYQRAGDGNPLLLPAG